MASFAPRPTRRDPERCGDVVDFIEEVEERLRSDRYATLARRILPWFLAAVLAVIVGWLGVWGYRAWRDRSNVEARLGRLRQGRSDATSRATWTGSLRRVRHDRQDRSGWLSQSGAHAAGGYSPGGGQERRGGRAVRSVGQGGAERDLSRPRRAESRSGPAGHGALPATADPAFRSHRRQKAVQPQGSRSLGGGKAGRGQDSGGSRRLSGPHSDRRQGDRFDEPPPFFLFFLLCFLNLLTAAATLTFFLTAAFALPPATFYTRCLPACHLHCLPASPPPPPARPSPPHTHTHTFTFPPPTAIAGRRPRSV